MLDELSWPCFLETKQREHEPYQTRAPSRSLAGSIFSDAKPAQSINYNDLFVCHPKTNLENINDPNWLSAILTDVCSSCNISQGILRVE